MWHLKCEAQDTDQTFETPEEAYIAVKTWINWTDWAAWLILHGWPEGGVPMIDSLEEPPAEHGWPAGCTPVLVHDSGPDGFPLPLSPSDWAIWFERHGWLEGGVPAAGLNSEPTPENPSDWTAWLRKYGWPKDQVPTIIEDDGRAMIYQDGDKFKVWL